ncbi:hypothetical protein EVA_05435 [gut metagenome]|uniref:Uncharacterized protein n=1 Tax=gut metagenome TaxID=749906 RepID=J9GHE0_9ZZZZ
MTLKPIFSKHSANRSPLLIKLSNSSKRMFWPTLSMPMFL